MRIFVILLLLPLTLFSQELLKDNNFNKIKHTSSIHKSNLEYIKEIKSENGKWKESFSQSKSQCRPADIVDHHPKLKEHFSTPRNQGEVGWCYGFVASDLLTVELGVPVSSIHSSMLYHKRRRSTLSHKARKLLSASYRKMNEDSLNKISIGGQTKLALQAIFKNKNICSEKNLPFNSMRILGTQGLIKSFEELKTQFQSIKNENIDDLMCNNINNFVTLNPELDINFNQLYQALRLKTADNAFTALINSHCSDLLKVPKLKVRSILKPRGKRRRTKLYFKKINKLLDEGKPIGITYHTAHIKVDGEQNHGSVLVGKKWIDGKCQYKIRNTWGQSCKGYSSLTVTDCNEDEGSFWVSEKTLYRMSRKLDFIK
jgi:hypothetical protein